MFSNEASINSYLAQTLVANSVNINHAGTSKPRIDTNSSQLPLDLKLDQFDKLEKLVDSNDQDNKKSISPFPAKEAIEHNLPKPIIDAEELKAQIFETMSQNMNRPEYRVVPNLIPQLVTSDMTPE